MNFLLSSKDHTEVPCAEKILYNGKIITVDQNFSIADSAAIRGGKLLKVGKKKDIDHYILPNTDLIDLKGKTVIPGLIDSHIHVYDMGIMLDWVNLSNVKLISELLSSIQKATERAPSDEWVICSWTWHESQLKEKRMPTCWELDKVSPDNPVFIPRGGHVCVVNSKALKLAGITHSTPNPKGGTIVKDNKGKPNGLLLENARNLVEDCLPEIDSETRLSGIIKANSELNSMGITAVFEAGLLKDGIRQYMELWRKNNLTVRTDMALYILNGDMEYLNIADSFYRDYGNDYLKIGAIKFLADGGIEGAYLKEPYRLVPNAQTDMEYRGKWFFDGRESDFQDMLMYCAKNKWQVQIHIVGDATLSKVLKICEEVDKKNSIADLRWTVMHCNLPDDKAIKKMKRLKMVVTVQGHPILLGYNMLKWWGKKRANYSIPIKTLLKHGCVVGGGTDAPVLPYDPFLTMWWMVTRKTLTTKEPLGKEQAISIKDALRLYTIGSAKTMFWEDKIGSIEEGKLADLVVLDRDILSIPIEEIKNINIEMTMLGGEVVYER